LWFFLKPERSARNLFPGNDLPRFCEHILLNVRRFFAPISTIPIEAGRAVRDRPPACSIEWVCDGRQPNAVAARDTGKLPLPGVRRACADGNQPSVVALRLLPGATCAG
jgi:hypothetical protein